MRLTIDIDNKKELVKIVKRINSFFDNRKLIDEIWLSSSGRGYHIIIYGLQITFEQCLELRSFFGDDKLRVYIDRIRDKVGHATQVLFTSKENKQAMKLYDSSTNLNALPKYIATIV